MISSQQSMPNGWSKPLIGHTSLLLLLLLLTFVDNLESCKSERERTGGALRKELYSNQHFNAEKTVHLDGEWYESEIELERLEEVDAEKPKIYIEESIDQCGIVLIPDQDHNGPLSGYPDAATNYGPDDYYVEPDEITTNVSGLWPLKPKKQGPESLITWLFGVLKLMANLIAGSVTPDKNTHKPEPQIRPDVEPEPTHRPRFVLDEEETDFEFIGPFNDDKDVVDGVLSVDKHSTTESPTIESVDTEIIGDYSEGQSRIVNGRRTVTNSWPWLVRLWWPWGLTQCGGAIISRRLILTAAHCVRNAPYIERLIVSTGDDIIGKQDKYEQQHSILGVYYPSNYNDDSVAHDYALIVLKKDIKYNTANQPLCLAPQNLDESPEKWPLRKPNADGDEMTPSEKPIDNPLGPDDEKFLRSNIDFGRCFTAGWGRTLSETNANRLSTLGSPELLETQLEPAQCPVTYEAQSTHTCYRATHNRHTDTCQGDSGGPVFCPIKLANNTDRWVLTAMVSYGSKSCKGTRGVGYVGVYTDVLRTRPLINAMIRRACDPSKSKPIPCPASHVMAG